MDLFSYISVCAFGVLSSLASFPIIQSYTGFLLTETVLWTKKGRLSVEFGGRTAVKRRRNWISPAAATFQTFAACMSCHSIPIEQPLYRSTFCALFLPRAQVQYMFPPLYPQTVQKKPARRQTLMYISYFPLSTLPLLLHRRRIEKHTGEQIGDHRKYRNAPQQHRRTEPCRQRHP